MNHEFEAFIRRLKLTAERDPRSRNLLYVVETLLSSVAGNDLATAFMALHKIGVYMKEPDADPSGLPPPNASPVGGSSSSEMKCPACGTRFVRAAP